MSMRFLALVGLLFATVSAAQEPASNDQAELSIFVFESLTPAAGVEIRLDGEVAATTNENGAVFLELTPEGHEVALDPPGASETVVIPLSLVPGENAQIIIRSLADGRVTTDIESSNKATESGGTASSGAEELILGDPGTLSALVFSADTGEPVPNARVFISGTPLDLTTDDDGRFSVELNVGVYSLSVLHADHATLTQDGIEIVSGQETAIDIELVPAGLELPEFVVLEPYVKGSLASVIEEQRTSAGVTNVLGSEQISRAGDSDAAGALKRVTGLTLVDGEFIYVRGLGERYATTALNAAAVPSPDPTRRVVPLNLFPASIISSVVVSKSYSADIPAGFGGGAVEIRTKAIPDIPFFELSFGLGYNSQTTGKTGFSYLGGDYDWTGFDSGIRDLPQELLEALESGRPLIPNQPPFVTDGFDPEVLEVFGESLPNIYSAREKDIGANRGFGATGGYRWDLDNGVAVGFLASLDYGDQWQRQPEVRSSFRLSNNTESGLEQFDGPFDIDRTIRNISLSGFLTAGIEFNENHNVNATFSYLRLTEDETFIQEGFLRDQGGDVRFTELRWEERELFSKQLFGSSLFPALGDLKLEWFFDDSEATRIAPDQRNYRQDFDENRGQFGLSLRPGASQRTYDDLVDETQNYGFSLQLPWTPTSWLDIIGEAGYDTFERFRDSQIFRLQYNDVGPLVNIDTLFLPRLENIFAPELIDPRGWSISSDATRPTDNYFAAQDIEAFFVAANITIHEEFKLYLGARDEESTQTAVTFDAFAAELEPIVAELVTDELYPTGTFTWEYNDTSQIRFAYAETVSRPDLRELSEAPFRDPILDLIVVGNPDLIETNIKHIDVRWEKYFSPSESVSLAYFRKEFENPIERIIESGAAQIGSFANALSAENEGWEVDFYNELGFAHRWLEGFYLAGNAAYISSSIELDPFESGNLTTQERPLQGQSDVVGNLQLGYDNENRGIQATLLFNHTGERISDVGSDGLPDIIEQPYNQLDFVYSQDFDAGWELKVKLGNLLDDEVEFLQSTEVRRAYKKGRTVSASVEFSFD